MKLEPIDLSAHTQIGLEDIRTLRLQRAISSKRLRKLLDAGGILWVKRGSGTMSYGTYVVSIRKPKDTSPEEIALFALQLVRPSSVLRNSFHKEASVGILDSLSSPTHVHIALF